MFSTKRLFGKHFTWRLLATAVLGLVVMGGLVLARAANSNSRQARLPVSVSHAKLNENTRIRESLGKLPIVFEANYGQTDSRVKFMARTQGYTLFLTPTEAVFATAPDKLGVARVAETLKNHRGSPSVLRMKMVGAARSVQIAGGDKAGAVSNYLVGKDPSKWHTNIPQFSRVQYTEIYPGIDLAFHGSEQQAEFDYIVKPQADARGLKLSFDGAEKIVADANGDLILSTKAGAMRLHKPVAYQEKAGTRTPVEARFALNENQVTFSIGSYDRSRNLVIDPVLAYSTYLGGAGDEQAAAIAVDANGNAYVTGITNSSAFPIAGGVAPNTFVGFDDVFVSELNPAGTALVFSTYIGGTGHDAGRGIAVDSTGIYVAGETGSDDFPIPPTTFSPDQNGGLDGFALKLNPGGSSLAWSGFIGGEIDDSAAALAIDSSGNVYIAGQTFSQLFPLTSNALFTNFNNGTDGFIGDGFVSVIKADGSAFLFSTYLGGSNDDRANGIAVDAARNIYVTGGTQSADFPVTDATTCHSCSGLPDAFVSKIKTDFSSLVYSTYLGGSLSDEGFAIVVDSSGQSVVTGKTTSTDFPTTTSAFQKTLGTGSSGAVVVGAASDAFVTKYNAAATAFLFSTYLGGDGADHAVGIALDSTRNVYVFGQTQSSNFPTQNPFQATLQGGSDAFVTELKSDGSGLFFSSYLGGTQQEGSLASLPGTNATITGGVALNSLNDMYVAGFTNSFDFPLATPFQNTMGGGIDGFVAKVTAATPAPSFSLAADPPAITVTAGESGSTDITVMPEAGFTGNVTFACTSGVPAKTTCSFAPATVGPTGTTTLTISTTGNGTTVSTASPEGTLPLYASLFPIFGLALIGASLKKRPIKKALLNIVLCGLMLSGVAFLAACGGGDGGNGGTPKGTFNVQVTGTSGLDSKSTTVSLTVQ